MLAGSGGERRQAANIRSVGRQRSLRGAMGSRKPREAFDSGVNVNIAVGRRRRLECTTPGLGHKGDRGLTRRSTRLVIGR